ncbi:MAG: hypothetical protein UFX20_00480 [Longibaculum muris]|uniref:PemK-like, MazF-like toxin of type II toxin-antitoxin system n=1 Tax=Longibaculum muris TaxID=1796628 RepID=A0A4R3Z6I3_9FIRM|nr:hypothetical protein [Longibaculum muris]KXU49000.1 hypothetical protein HMPREF3037_01648 [Candidatus Stoquefichus sp. KLE1796]MBS5371299.1 hypothetical protein [Coprobacillus cateniformis]MCR1886781.1 type II toxin-antitoxin system PemK/MazF family toxin [Longibaculum muris]MED9810559.1 hypothetical protein [Longibaculum muris]TCW02810.1 hypothetical protein EDD60_101113 [Longibaculum muris]
MSVQSNLMEMNESLKKLEQSGIYDVEKYSYALLHQTNQLEYFYCHLVKDGDCDDTYYHVHKRPHVHELAYFNIGRGFPKELMDGHWCYVLKDMGYKMLVIPCTSIKKDSTPANPLFEKDIKIKTDTHITQCRIQLSDIRSVDIQRLDLRKSFYEVLTPKEEIIEFVEKNLFDMSSD